MFLFRSKPKKAVEEKVEYVKTENPLMRPKKNEAAESAEAEKAAIHKSDAAKEAAENDATAVGNGSKPKRQ